MDYEIRPFRGVGSIEFGMSPEEVRSRVGKYFTSFKSTPTAAYPSDYFPSVGVFAYYKASGELEALELSLPAQPSFEGVNLFSIGFDDAKALLQSKNIALEFEANGAIARTLGISFYAPAAKENSSEVCESVLVFEKGYYD